MRGWLRRMAALALMALLAACTVIRTPHVTYVNLLREKSLAVALDEEGRARSVQYNTTLDPAVEALARLAGEAAAKGAVP